MSNYKILLTILIIVLVASIVVMLYFTSGNSRLEPKSKAVTTTSTTEITPTTEETTTKVLETQQVLIPASVAPQITERTLTTVILGKSYQLDPDTGRMASADQIELRAKYAELERQQEAKQPTGLGGANLDG